MNDEQEEGSRSERPLDAGFLWAVNVMLALGILAALLPLLFLLLWLVVDAFEAGAVS